ncbi:MAG: isoleucine--tRNA ligase [Pirellulaceae bacterium]
MFAPIPNHPSFPKLEETTLEFWRERRIYEKSQDQREGGPSFVFFEGPPTANGLPHPGHCLTRAVKDVFPRYRTMQGYHCLRKAGWDTHGLPVEVEVCKEMGIHSKDEIEAFGVEPFIHRCQESVWRYMQEWEKLTERLGFWIRLDEAYVTYHQSYIQSVWWSLKTLFDRGLLYRGNKIVWWWAQGGTALSAGEVGQGYREVADPSVFVRFPIKDQDNTSLLVWTTTPWTLPSNQFAAVHPELTYATVEDEESGERLIIAEALVEVIAGKSKRKLNTVGTCQGEALIGLSYVPPFSDFYNLHDEGAASGRLKSGGTARLYWRVIAADFVTTDSGTGLVHQSPAFGEVDHDILVQEIARFEEGEAPELFCPVGPDGCFTEPVSKFAGRWVKEADRDIIRDLKERGKLFHQEQYLHDYPFCWRADKDPLIQYPRESWFIRTSQFKDQLLANNDQIQWQPEHIRDGRFGKFLRSNVDWALSRERFWGTPLPIWVCQETGRMEAIGHYDELLEKPGIDGTQVWEEALAAKPDLCPDLKVHKPYIDAITYDSPFATDARMHRVPEVIDCWYDSGAMPFAQWGYPHQGVDQFNSQFPADFISEAIDQTRGWFYSQLAISTLLFGEDANAAQSYPHPFRNCIVLGLMLAEWWEDKEGRRFLNEEEARSEGEGKLSHRIGKMSKSLRNYRSPQEIFDAHGADALRWYFFANQPPWNEIIYSERSIKESIPEFLLRLWNVYSFFVIYANMDGFDPSDGIDGSVGMLNGEDLSRGQGYRPANERAELDRWILSELQNAVSIVVERMDAYDNYNACRALTAFVDGLSNWYVRSSRARFWNTDKQSQDKRDAYWTLYECLVTVTKLIAPFTPFLAETFWQNLAGVFQGRAVESVHLCDYPSSVSNQVDRQLSEQMELLRTLASLGRNSRMSAKLKVRQPLAEVVVLLADTQHQTWLEAHDDLLRKELNVEQITYTDDDQYIDYRVTPNFKRLGPRVGKLMPHVKKAIASAMGSELLAQLNEHQKVVLQIDGQDVEFDNEDLEVSIQAKEGWVAADDHALGCVVVLNTELTPKLLRKGMSRDLIRFANDRRKAIGCEYNDKIELAVDTSDEEVILAIDENRDVIIQECQAISLGIGSLSETEAVEIELGGLTCQLHVRVVS